MGVVEDILEGKYDKELTAIYKAVNERLSYWTPTRLAEAARQAMEENPETSEEHWARLINNGIIDEKGNVLIKSDF
ncbi:MAG: hypothetical protein DWQ19_11285 [Crenarchaeota archaeon]|nr:MAG: hypothetical protein DWQ19_11285 [Thermoproteota archaeon]